MERGRPRLRQDGLRDAHSPRLSFVEAKALKRRVLSQLATEAGRSDLAHLRDCNCFTVAVSPCLRKLNIRDKCKAKRFFPQAFSHVAKVRRVQVDAGYRVIGEGAWRHCQHL